MTTQTEQTGPVPSRIERYDPTHIEPHWQARWEALGMHQTDLHDTSRPSYYVLTMYPYPSGDLHVGHWSIMTPTDALARFHRMHGHNVFFPIGFDAFGLPAENAAIANGMHPRDWTLANIEGMRRQLRSMGNTFDWSAEIVTSDPDFYRWNQWIFLRLLEQDLAYRRMAPVDWCPRDQVVLAREQVEGPERRCWRCGTQVIKRDLEQWFFRTTAYADELLRYPDITWPAPIRVMQTNWIGRSEGARITFTVAPDRSQPGGDAIEVFTTRADTLFGATFMVLAPEHPLVERLTHPGQWEEVEAYRDAARHKSEIDRLSADREKTGVSLGSYAINPIDGERVPIWIADYVLLGYGTGAIMAVPAHDERDFDFARRHQLPIRRVVAAPGTEDEQLDGAFIAHTEGERLVDSGSLTGMSAPDGARAITETLRERGLGQSAVTYRLRDWLISRQRAWGTPIPVVYCLGQCGIVPVPDDELPVRLPDDFQLPPQGGNPLETHEGFLHTTCPRCGEAARRETDTMDTFVDSSWYWWRYLSPHKADGPIDRELADRWCPVDQYTGGAEHAVLHLLYSRFFCKALADLDLIAEREPFLRLFNQGQILGEGGLRMSKSRGNVQDPDELVARYGADSVRLFLMFMKPWEADAPWSATGLTGMFRFLNRVWAVTLDAGGTDMPKPAAGAAVSDTGDLRRLAHRTLREVTDDYQGFSFNTLIARLMELTNALTRARGTAAASGADFDEATRLLLLMLAPVAPHITEELWQRRSSAGAEEWQSIHAQPWPAWDPALTAVDEIDLPVQVNGKLRDLVALPPGLPAAEVEQRVMERDKIRAQLAGKELIRVVHVPGRLVNLVVR
ncbi:leucine--tRNA ligase [soil metagenome]